MCLIGCRASKAYPFSLNPVGGQYTYPVYPLLENPMAASPDTVSMAMFCDFENVALGVRDANYEKFDIKPVLERLLLKGSIVLKKAYCDWDRYKGFKATMHEANFELIEIPHVRQSGKNSADIRMVVDALDLCYTKSHVNTFVIVSGDSDFSPLVSKLRENAKYVIGVGVKQSTSDLLIANCDEFIFYDDLVRESLRSAARRDPKAPQPIARRSPEELEARKSEAVELAVATFEALIVERGDTSKIWASMLKEAIKRRKPDFNESNFGFRSFGNLLEEAQTRGLLDLGRDEKSGAFVYRNVPSSRNEPVPVVTPPALQVAVTEEAAEVNPESAVTKSPPRRRGRGDNRRQGNDVAAPARSEPQDTTSVAFAEPAPVEAIVPLAPDETATESVSRPRGRVGNRRQSERVRAVSEPMEALPAVQESPAPVAAEAPAAEKPLPRNRRPRKPKASSDSGVV